MEAVQEASYGQLSFSWDVRVTPTQYIPYDTLGRTAYLYNDLPTHPYLASLGINETQDYHTILVSGTKVFDCGCRMQDVRRGLQAGFSANLLLLRFSAAAVLLQ